MRLASRLLRPLLSVTATAAALAVVLPATAPTAPTAAAALPAPVADLALDLADRADPSGALTPYVRDVVDEVNGPLLNPGPPAPVDTTVPCRTSPAHPRPVVLAHGTFEGGPRMMATIGADLAARGFCVVAPTLGAYAGNPGRGELDSIAGASGPQLAAVIDAARAATGADQVDLVGYSQGASVAGYTAKVLRPGAVRTVVSIAGYWGADPSGLVPAQTPPQLVQAALFAGNMRGLSELVPGTPMMTAWNAGGSPFQWGTGYTLIASDGDPVVPPVRSFVSGPGVRLVDLEDVCGGPAVHHGAIVVDRRTHDVVASALGAPGGVCS